MLIPAPGWYALTCDINNKEVIFEEVPIIAWKLADQGLHPMVQDPKLGLIDLHEELAGYGPSSWCPLPPGKPVIAKLRRELERRARAKRQ
jgi:hypothetical protein